MKSSDLTQSIIIIGIFIVLYLVNLFIVSVQRIKDNWPLYRCSPTVMPFASLFGHDTQTNFAFCIQTMQKAFMEPILKPLNFNIDVLGNITGGLGSNILDIRSFLNVFRINISTIFGNLFGSVYNVMIEIQRTFLNVKDMLGKMVGIMVTLIYILQGSIMAMQSSWDGPMGGLVRALCFHPETQVTLQNGETLSMKDIPLNSILKNGTRVCAVMEISNLDEKGEYIEKMYKVRRRTENSNVKQENADILVSGSHLVFDPNARVFVHVKDLPLSELTEINCPKLSCLITSDHTIPIGEWIFHDWEDSNGSAPKNIGKKV
jgi:hypothetical protein